MRSSAQVESITDLQKRMRPGLISLVLLGCVFASFNRAAEARKEPPSRPCPNIGVHPADQALTSVAVGGRGGVVAVGWTKDKESERRIGAAWTLSQSRPVLPVLPPVTTGAGEGTQQVLSIMSDDNAFLAVGRHDDRAAAWVSLDGQRWRPAPGLEDQKLVGVMSSMRAAVRLGRNIVVGGWICPEKMGSRQAAVWTSSDLETWVRRPVPNQNDSLQLSMGVPEAQINDIVVSKDRLYAVGTMKATPLLGRKVNWDAAVWMSTDGVTWQQVKADTAGSGAGDQYMSGVTTWAGSLVAVGGSGYGLNTTAVVWISRDGVTWSRAAGARDFAIPGESQSINAATTVGKVIVAVGYKEIIRQKWARIWTSMDGENWTLGETASRSGEALSVERLSSGAALVVGWQRPDPSAAALGWSESRAFSIK